MAVSSKEEIGKVQDMLSSVGLIDCTMFHWYLCKVQ